MRQILAAVLGFTLMGEPALAEITSVETMHGVARIEGTTSYPDAQRLVIGDKEIIRAEGAQQVVWIEAEIGPVLLVGLRSVGNGCYDGYAFVDLRGAEPRVTEQFGSCGGNVEVEREGDLVTGDGIIRVTMDSPNPNEGRLEYQYDGERVTERVMGQRESHSPPTASARNWIDRAPREVFEGVDWREPLVSLIGEAAYKEAQESFDLHTDGMQLSEGWVAGMSIGNRDSSGSWGAVAINVDDRRLLVVLGRAGEAPRFWGDPRGPLPAAVVEAIAYKDPLQR